MNNHFHQQEFLFNNLKNSPSNKILSIPNFSFDPDFLGELNARYLHSMNATDTINGNGFCRCVRSKHHHHHLNISTPKCNKWCTAHVRISWMIYHQQQHFKEKLSLIDNKKELLLNNFISNTKSILPFSSILPPTTFNNRSPFDVSYINKDSFGGLASLFPSNRFSSINQNFSSKELDQINGKDLLLSVNNNHDHLHFYNNLTNSLSRKGSSKNFKSSSHSFRSTIATFHPLTLSIIERQRLSAAYTSLLTPVSQENNFFPINLDPIIFGNHNSSNLFSNLDPSSMTNTLIQHQHFIHSLRLSQQQNIEREHGTIENNNLIQIKKSLKTKFEQISSINKEETKRIKLENTTSTSNSSLSSSIK